MLALSEILASDTDDDVRLAATRALGAFNDPAAIRGLAVALDDTNTAIQYRAMESLKRSTGRNLGNDIVAWRTFVESVESNGSPTESREGPSLVRRMRERF
jgi:HEAT repeat protein